MGASIFEITEHVVPCQHIREYARATIQPDGPLDLVIKQYTPKSNPDPQPGDVTIIATHGSGFPKELYEPFLEEICFYSEKKNFRIRSIWFADAAHQGASGIRNEKNLGNDPSWFDHSRDLLVMVNHFRKEMVRPIIGIGHSMGACQLILTSLLHPRLFVSLVLMEPVFEASTFGCLGPALTHMSTFRRDMWPSREEAQNAARKAYKNWDERVLQRWFEFGYRSLPTVIYPDVKSETQVPEHMVSSFHIETWLRNRSANESTTALDAPVTLATTKHQEVFSYLRPNFKGILPNSSSLPETVTGNSVHAQIMDDLDRMETADVVGPPGTTAPFYRAEPIIIHLALPHIRPSVLYIFGERSPLSTPEQRQSKLGRTGVGIGGSGGLSSDRVRYTVIPKGTHAVPMEAVDLCADATATWLGETVGRWKTDEARFMADWETKTLKERATVSPEWVKNIKSVL